MDSSEYMRDFLLTHYKHLSELWKRRDEMRISFLRFYFLFLGGVVTVTGFITQLNETGTIEVETLLKSGLLKIFLVISFFVGLSTFFLITFIRLHNAQCVFFMHQIAKWFDDVAATKIGSDVTHPFLVKVHRRKGIDFTNALMIALLNTIILWILLYDKCKILIVLIVAVSIVGHIAAWYCVLKSGMKYGNVKNA